MRMLCHESDQLFIREIPFSDPNSFATGSSLRRMSRACFTREEEFGAKTGERRAIRLANADRLEGPYQIYEGPRNNG